LNIKKPKPNQIFEEIGSVWVDNEQQFDEIDQIESVDEENRNFVKSVNGNNFDEKIKEFAKRSIPAKSKGIYDRAYQVFVSFLSNHGAGIDEATQELRRFRTENYKHM